ncbi:MAG: Tad domain-containing protein [Pseudomonadota bacterium]
MKHTLSRATDALQRRAPRFLRREDGTITVFGTMIFVLMVGIGGIAVDIMRYETQRVQLQSTLDRAVLAAASLTQTMDPEDVVHNYFEVAGLEDYRLRVEVIDGLNFRRVNAIAEMETQSIFMSMFGVRVLTSPAAGAAEERIQNVEISMVLDISGSMGNQNRMENMRPAARDFVSTVLEANEDSELGNLVSISIVPYNGRVNAGDTIESVFNLASFQTESSCVRFRESEFSQTAISPNSPLDRLAHWDRGNQNNNRSFVSPHCQTDNYGAILPWEHRETVLHEHINSLGTQGWTAIDLGMKWAVGLLDPAARPAVNALVENGQVHPDFEDRPADYTASDTLKVVVLMTDGANTNQYDLRDEFKYGNSVVFYHEADDRYSVYWQDRPGEQDYWIPSGNPSDGSGSWSTSPYGGNAAEALTWAELFAARTEENIAQTFFRAPAQSSGQWGLYNRMRSASRQYAGRTQGDANLRAICDAVRIHRDFVVFAIAFEAPQGGQDVMRHCATTPGHYYDVQGLDIADAFASIARTINQLRLVQ